MASHPYVGEFSMFSLIAYNFIFIFPFFIYCHRLLFFMTPHRLSSFNDYELLEYKWFYDNRSDVIERCYVRVVDEVYRGGNGYNSYSYYDTDKTYSSWYELDMRLIFGDRIVKLSKFNDFIKNYGNVGKLLNRMDCMSSDKDYSSFKLRYDTEKAIFYLLTFVFLFLELIMYLSKNYSERYM